jgi:hypothetical protein
VWIDDSTDVGRCRVAYHIYPSPRILHIHFILHIMCAFMEYSYCVYISCYILHIYISRMRFILHITYILRIHFIFRIMYIYTYIFHITYYTHITYTFHLPYYIYTYISYFMSYVYIHAGQKALLTLSCRLAPNFSTSTTYVMCNMWCVRWIWV